MADAGIGYDAENYSKTKQHPFRTDVEWYTIFKLLGNIRGQRVLDAGCGTGIHSREMIRMGARRVIALDGDKKFIQLAKQQSEAFGGRIDFRHEMIQDSQGASDCDQALGSYVMSYPKSLEEAIAFCNGISSHLKAGGRFVGFNNNPFDIFIGSRYGKYGCEKIMTGDAEGAEVIWRVANPHGLPVVITNSYLRPNTYEQAFRKAGFSEVEWVPVQIDPQSKRRDSYWREFLSGNKRFPSPFVAMVAVK